MAFIDFENMPSPAPSYSSTFGSQDISDMPRHTSFTAVRNNGMPYHPSAKYEPPVSSSQLWEKRQPEDEEEAQIKPDYSDSNHPQFANSAPPAFPAVLPPRRSRIPAKRVLIPWVLFVIFFLNTVWYTSMLFGARFLSIVRPVPPSFAAQEIIVYIHGELVQGTVSVSTRLFAAPTSTTTSIAQTPSPTNALPISGNTGLPDVGNELGRISSDVGRTAASTPTGFVTITRGIP